MFSFGEREFSFGGEMSQRQRIVHVHCDFTRVVFDFHNLDVNRITSRWWRRRILASMTQTVDISCNCYESPKIFHGLVNEFVSLWPRDNVFPKKRPIQRNKHTFTVPFTISPALNFSSASALLLLLLLFRVER